MTHAYGLGGGWARGYDYHAGTNRLRATSVAPDDLDDPENYTDDAYTHDAHGNMTAMSAIPGGLTWDEDDRLQQTMTHQKKDDDCRPELVALGRLIAAFLLLWSVFPFNASACTCRPEIGAGMLYLGHW